MQTSLMTLSSAQSAYTAHTHDLWEIGICIEGEGVYHLGEQSSPFPVGGIYLCPPGISHCREEVAQDRFCDLFIRFDDDQMLSGFGGGFFLDDAEGTLVSLASVAYKLYNEDFVGNSDAINMILGAFCRIVMDKARVDALLSESVIILRDEINRRFLDPDYKVADTIDALDYNPDYMRRLFKQEMGRTPSDYLTEKRVENAKKLLACGSTPELSVAEIAFICGFYDSNYFTRVFKKETGVLPTAYRKGR